MTLEDTCSGASNCQSGPSSNHHWTTKLPAAPGSSNRLYPPRGSDRKPLPPEQSEHTSAKTRVDLVHRQRREADLQLADVGSVAASRASGGLEEDLWLVPIEDRRRLDSQREGMLKTFTLGNYLKLMDYTGRLLRDGKASIDAELADILTRIGSSAEAWQARMRRLSGGRLVGRFISGSRERLRELAGRLGVTRLAHLSAASS